MFPSRMHPICEFFIVLFVLSLYVFLEYIHRFRSIKDSKCIFFSGRVVERLSLDQDKGTPGL
uniref:Uncharacterized protein n=1 Tax=Rhizophora mucronata TaxID=61149 RepID=A0A2P2JDX4_RHIMU